MMKNNFIKSVINIIGYSFVVVSITGCAQWHINKAEKLSDRAEKHIEKAVEKGAEIITTPVKSNGDTTIITYWKDSILHIDRTITDTVYMEGEVVYVSKSDKRKEARAKKKEVKKQDQIAKDKREHDQKVEIVKARREHKDGSNGVWIVITGFLCFILGFVSGWKFKK